MRSVVVVAIACLAVAPARAHGLRSAYVDVRELEPGRALVQLRQSAPGATLAVHAEAPCDLSVAGEASVLTCPGGLAGRALVVDGLGPVIADAVAYVALADGKTATYLVRASDPRFELAPARPPDTTAVAGEFVGFGLIHIFTGFDHLLFLVLLVLLLREPRAVIVAETAFTLSHSVSFTATALGWIHVPEAAAETCIALSLLLLAADIRLEGPAAARWRGAAMAFVFGCVHGLGFAGGLRELGVPEHAIAPALVGFAAGVELGQVAFLAGVLVVLHLARRARWRSRGELASLYAIGGFSAYLVFERALGL